MKNPWLSYSILRIGLFAALFGILMLLDFNPFFAAIIAASISFAISLVFLDKQRRAMSEQVAKKFSRDESGSYTDPESDLENQILDSSEVDQNNTKTDK